MVDIAIKWDPARYRGDWDVTSGDLVTGPGLETAVLLSLFTDRVADPSFIPPPGEPFDRRGWWGDTYEPSPIGSRLWQLNRAVKTDGTTLLAEARDYCLEALQWLKDAGVVASIDVTTWWLAAQSIGIKITIAQPQSPPQTFDYAWAWGANNAPQKPGIPSIQPSYVLDPSGGFLADPVGGYVGSP